MLKNSIFISIFLMLILSCEKEKDSGDTSKEVFDIKEIRIKKIVHSESYQEFSYDSIGRIKETNTHFVNDTINLFHHSYYYNEQSELDKIISKNKTFYMHRHEFTYTDSSIIELIVECQSDVWIESYKHEYIFNSYNECIKKKIFNESLTSPLFYYAFTWEDGNIIKEEEISCTSGLEYTRVFEYDNVDNLYNSVTSDVRTHPFYHTKNNPLSYSKTSVWEDDFLPASYTYTFDKENKTVQVEITDEYGDIISYSIAFEEK